VPIVDHPGLEELTLAAGETVLAEGQTHHVLLVLVSGSVRITSGGTEISVIDKPGAVFGEMAALLDGEATATVTTLEESRFLRSSDPLTVLRDQPGFALEVATTLAHRLDLVTRYLADLRAQYADRADHLGVVDEVLESLLQRQPTGVEPGSDREPEAPY
jgi:CRP/FNR family cyclic AMP-dependent transcriptional regulator